MSRIDRIRHIDFGGRAVPSDVERPEPPERVEAAPADRAPTPRRRAGEDAAAAFSAQLIGQDGQKRGLRAGPAHIDAARGAYVRVEWSGSRDRRARKGRNARTEI